MHDAATVRARWPTACSPRCGEIVGALRPARRRRPHAVGLPAGPRWTRPRWTGWSATAAAVEDIYPLTPMQAGMLFHGLVAADRGVYFEQATLVLAGVADPARLGRGLAAGGRPDPGAAQPAWSGRASTEPVQVVRPAAPPCRSPTSTGGRCPSGSAAELDRAAAPTTARAGLDLTAAPLLRLTLVRLSGDEVLLVWTFHHVAAGRLERCPGASTEVCAGYAASRRRPPGAAGPPPVPRLPATGWPGRTGAAAERYWRRRAGRVRRADAAAVRPAAAPARTGPVRRPVRGWP